MSDSQRFASMLLLGIALANSPASAEFVLEKAPLFELTADVRPAAGPYLQLNLIVHRDGLSVQDVSEDGATVGRRIVRSTATPSELNALRRAIKAAQIAQQRICNLREAEPLGGRISYSISWIRGNGRGHQFTAAAALSGVADCPPPIARLINAAQTFARAQETHPDSVTARWDAIEASISSVQEGTVFTPPAASRLLLRSTLSRIQFSDDSSRVESLYAFRDGLLVGHITTAFRGVSQQYVRAFATAADLAALEAALALSRIGQAKSCFLPPNIEVDQIRQSFAWVGLAGRTNQFVVSTQTPGEPDCLRSLQQLHFAPRDLVRGVLERPSSVVVSF